MVGRRGAGLHVRTASFRLPWQQARCQPRLALERGRGRDACANWRVQSCCAALTKPNCSALSCRLLTTWASLPSSSQSTVLHRWECCAWTARRAWPRRTTRRAQPALGASVCMLQALQRATPAKPTCTWWRGSHLHLNPGSLLGSLKQPASHPFQPTGVRRAGGDNHREWSGAAGHARGACEGQGVGRGLVLCDVMSALNAWPRSMPAAARCACCLKPAGQLTRRVSSASQLLPRRPRTGAVGKACVLQPDAKAPASPAAPACSFTPRCSLRWPHRLHSSLRIHSYSSGAVQGPERQLPDGGVPGWARGGRGPGVLPGRAGAAE